MAHTMQVYYDETRIFSRNIHTDGDDILALHARTRQRVHALRADWSGEAAEAFFEEMEAELLPALQRVSNALFLAEEILDKIIKIIQDADEGTADDMEQIGDEENGPSPSIPLDDPHSSEPGSQKEMKSVEEAAMLAAAAAAGGGFAGGGGGGVASQGLQGGLSDSGAGVGSAGNGYQQFGAAGGGGSQGTPDHIYSSPSDGSSDPGSATPPAQAGNAGSSQAASAGSGGIAAAAAGVLGAGAAAAKIIQNNQEESPA